MDKIILIFVMVLGLIQITKNQGYESRLEIIEQQIINKES